MKETTSQEVSVLNSGVANFSEQFKSLNDFRIALQGFSQKINEPAKLESIGKTPDGNASHIYISHVEMTLDEMFFGLWETRGFNWQLISNEVVGSIDLVVTHPVTGLKYTRTGAAAIQIMVDAVPPELKFDQSDSPTEAAERKRKRNEWALNVSNKKPAALDLAFPKLKAECIKNAALSLGKLFGRDLNRDVDKSDTYNPLVKKIVELPEELKLVIDEAELEAIPGIWNNNKDYHSNPEFHKLLNERKIKLQGGANNGK
jgi:hypothetical protein